VDEGDVRRALARVGLAPELVRPIEGGWANFTFDLDGERIVRFPRNDSVALATQRELHLLPALAPTLSYPVPVPTHVGRWRGRPFFAYDRIEGTPLTALPAPADLAERMGRVVAELHAFPVERAASLLATGSPEASWWGGYEDLWEVVEQVALPELDTDLADAVRRHLGRLLDDRPAFEPALVHDDLGPEHILLRPDGTIALIDFEDATVGDPAVDLTWLVAELGPAALPALLAGRDLGERLGERLWVYRWMGSVHAVIYGVTAGVESERVGGAREVRRRMAVPPPC
jgi:aminoglycoside phosphotransferase (APT) family kinase protein